MTLGPKLVNSYVNGPKINSLIKTIVETPNMFERNIFFGFDRFSLKCSNLSILDLEKCSFFKAGAELGQAQLKLELELCYTSFEICYIEHELSELIPLKSDLKWSRYC